MSEGTRSAAAALGRVRSPRAPAIAAAAGCLGVAGFQAALAAGAPFGRAAWGGQQTELPTPLRIGSGIAVAVWILAAGIVAKRGGVDVPAISGRVARRAVRPAIAILVLGAAMNVASRSSLERGIWAPFGAILALLFFVVERRAARRDGSANDEALRLDSSSNVTDRSV